MCSNKKYSDKKCSDKMRGGSLPTRLITPALLGLALACSGCMVKSHCQADYDCAAAETCDPASGSCYVECTGEQDCLVDGVDLGKRCIDNRCEFLFDERVPAPGFCLEVANPRSPRFGEDYCIDQQQGKVVMIFFGLLA